jgi:hypothetical protein
MSAPARWVNDLITGWRSAPVIVSPSYGATVSNNIAVTWKGNTGGINPVYFTWKINGTPVEPENRLEYYSANIELPIGNSKEIVVTSIVNGEETNSLPIVVNVDPSYTGNLLRGYTEPYIGTDLFRTGIAKYDPLNRFPINAILLGVGALGGAIIVYGISKGGK